MIKKDKMYCLSEMVDEKMFNWISDYKSYRNLVEKDFFKENILQTETTGTGVGKRYYIKGRNIIKFINKYGDGLSLRKTNEKK